MAGSLLIIGLTLFLLGSAGLMSIMSRRGYSASLVLLPFGSLRFVQRNWAEVWLPALARILGLALIIAAGAVALARDPLILEQPERLFGTSREPVIVGSKKAEMNSFVNSSAAIMHAIQNDENDDLSGRLHGQKFVYDRVEIIDGVLTASQGQGFLPDLELRILLNRDLVSADERQSVYVQPGDENPPVVHVSWRDDEGVMQTEIIRAGYRMELEVAPLDRYQRKGFMQLILPDAYLSFLSGEFVANTNHLRYRGSRVDLTYDHPDTLKYLAEEYIDKQFPEGAIAQLNFVQTDINRMAGSGYTVALLRLDNGRAERRRVPLERSEIGWSVEAAGVETQVLREAGDEGRISGLDEMAGPEKPKGERPPETWQVEFMELAEHIDKQVETHRLDGKVQSGILRQVSDKRLEVEASVGSGSVRYSVKRDELQKVILANGDTLMVTPPEEKEAAAPAVDSDGPAPAPTEQASTPPPASPDDSAQTETVEAPAPEASGGGRAGSLEDWRALQGSSVTITNQSGQTRSGVLKSVSEKTVTLSVQMGAGSVDYFYKPGEIRSLKPVAAP
jgi:hypothetical protein